MDSKVEQLLSKALSVAELQQKDKTVDVNEAIDLGRAALDLCPPGHHLRLIGLKNLASHLCDRYTQLGRIKDLHEAIALARDALSLCSPDKPDPAVLSNLASYLSSRYEQLGGLHDLDEAIVLTRDSLSLFPSGNHLSSAPLNNLAFNLYARYKRLGKIDDLHEAIVLARDTLSLHPPGHPQRSLSMSNLACYLGDRYNQLGKIQDLDEAIILGRGAISLHSSGKLDRWSPLNNVALYLFTRYKQLGEIDDLKDAIALGREAVLLCPPGRPDRSTSLSNIAAYLSARYTRFGELDDLNEGIILARDALSLCPPGNPSRATSLGNVAALLSTRYRQLGKLDDLHGAIAMARESLPLRPPGHPLRPMSLNNLAHHLLARHSQLGAIEDLDEAIVLGRDAVSLCPPGHHLRLTSLDNVAIYLSCRYQRLGGIDDLNEAIIHAQDALSLSPPGHYHRSTSLNNIAPYLLYRYNKLGKIDDLNEAIVLAQDALSLCPSGHHLRPYSLNNAASHLFTRYGQLSKIDDLNEAIALCREALTLRPPGHPDRSTSMNNISIYLYGRHRRFMEINDLNEAIVLCKDALALRPTGHPDRSVSLGHLALCLYTRFTQLDQAEDKQELFSLYIELQHVSQTVSSNDLFAAKAWIGKAEEFHHPTTLLAYETALRLLVEHLTSLPSLPHHLAVLRSLSSSLAVDAFSACLRNQSPIRAVEFLEQGRGVFWSQLTRLRSPLDDVIASGQAGKPLADEFTRLTAFISAVLRLPGADQHDRVCHLNLELQKVVSRIRELPGLSRFLLPSLFSDLQHAASDGPIIIVNASKYGCDALVVFADKDPIHIPLSVRREDVQELVAKLRSLIRLAKRAEPMNTEMEKRFMFFLRELWDAVVSRIFDVLQTTCPSQSRIWWCPTAEFSLLPLHAAAPYRKGQKGVSDLYISSYTTTLAALIRARRPNLLDAGTEKRRFIAIGQGHAAGSEELPFVSTELASVGDLVDGPASFTRLEGEASCVSNVADELGKHEWVHFACHGIPDQKQPFESGFRLYDGLFTVQRIIQCDLQNPEFAYLSACHTTVGDQESPDEVIHLASAMQFAGFRSVIGTMWAVDDSETNKIVSTFYKLIVGKSDRLDYTRAAMALRKTTRTVNIPMDQRILYIHLGV